MRENSNAVMSKTPQMTKPTKPTSCTATSVVATAYPIFSSDRSKATIAFSQATVTNPQSKNSKKIPTFYTHSMSTILPTCISRLVTNRSQQTNGSQNQNNPIKHLMRSFALLFLLLGFNSTVNAQTGPNDDFDGDGIINSIDIDDDNDGVLDLVECPQMAPYRVYTYNRAAADLAQNVPVVITGSTTQTVLLDQRTQGVAPNNFTAAGLSTWKLLASDIIPNAQNKISVKIAPTSTTLGTYAVVDAMLITNGVNTYIIDNTSTVAGEFATTGTWISQTIPGAYSNNSNQYVQTPFASLPTATWTFTMPDCKSTDNDGLADYFDLDSDGDGCSDALEAGATTNTTTDFAFPIAGVGTNGLADALETTADNGIVSYTSTYTNYALNSNIKSCTDTDRDGIFDLVDLDDDNDGVPDTMENFGNIAGASYTTYVGGATSGSGTINNTCSNVNFSIATSAGATLVTTYAGINMVTTNACVFNSANFSPALPSANTIGLSFPGLAGAASGTMTITFDKPVTNPVLYFGNVDLKYLDFAATAGLNGIAKTAGNTSFLVQGTKVGRLDQTAANTTTSAFLPCTADAGGPNLPGFGSIRLYGTFTTITANAIAISGTTADIMVFDIGLDNLACDKDNDTIPDYLDTDSDGDGCSDAKEAGATTSLTANYTFTNVGTNGLADALETTADNGTLNYVPSYSQNALNAIINACLDTDNDGVTDLIDVDDDNDGVLDAVESPSCYFSANNWNTLNKSSIASVTTDLNMLSPNTNLAALTDGLNTAAVQFVSAVAQSQLNKELLKIELVRPTQLSTIYINRTTGVEVFGPLANSLKVQGSNDDMAWTDLTPAMTLPVSATNVTNNGAVTLANSNKFTLTTNLAPYKYYRIFGVGATNAAAGIISEIYMDVNTTVYQASLYPTATCTADIDKDGKLNHLDLDSDGDGCADAVEAGTASLGTTAVSATSFFNPTTTGANGFANALETATESGVYVGAYTYDYAINNGINACTDTDNDGINDIVDIDDDNDGVLDAVESPACFYTDAEMEKPSAVTTDLAPYTTNTIEYSIDASGTTYSAFAPSVNWVGKALFNFTANSYIAISGMSFDLFNWAISNGAANTFKLQGSNDNATWTDLSAAVASTATTGTFTVNNTLAPTTKFKYFRILGVAGVSYYGGVYTARFILPTTYNASANPKLTCTNDTDGDGKNNHLDLDSDGDGCADAIEAGSSTTATSTTVYPTGTDANTNGLLNNYEGTTAGTVNYTSTYDYALSNTINACLDTDGDGTTNVKDLDDDNDGVLDITECPSTELVSNGDFTNGAIGWTVESGWNTSGGIAAINTDNVNNVQLYQTITKPVSYNYPGFIDIKFDVRTNGYYNNINNAYVSTLALKINNVQYAVFTNPANTSTATVVVENGAITSTNMFPIGTNTDEFTTVVISVPSSVFVTSNTLSFSFTSSVDDFSLDNVTVSSGPSLANCDTDSDGIPNSLDLDSDGDGCADAIEAGSSTTATSTTVYPTGTDTNTNGLLNNYEGTTDGTVNYASTYADYALTNSINACTDTDNDGITDLVDIDDDNDGVLDAVESPACFFTANEWNTTNKAYYAKFSSQLSPSATNNFAALGDGNGTAAAVQIQASQDQNNKELFKIEMMKPTQLDAIYFKKTTATQIFAATAASIKVQGSNDNSAWIDLTAAIASPADATNVTANGAVSLTNSNKFTLTTNPAAYKYFRIYGVAAANTVGGIASEIYFDVNTATYNASRYPKVTCASDTDGDGVPNHLDLDSDGDGCSDAKEASSSTTATSTTVYPTGTDSNTNGLLNNYEGTTAGTVNYTSTYTTYALAANLNFCTDTDGDGKGDLIDIDDDNDGVLDIAETTCYSDPSTNAQVLIVDESGSVDATEAIQIKTV